MPNTLPKEAFAVRTSSRREPRYSLFLPFVIVILVQMGLTSRDLLVFHQRKVDAIRENAKAGELLQKSSQQLQEVRVVQGELVRLSITDPTAAKIVYDYFPESRASLPQTPPAPGGH